MDQPENRPSLPETFMQIAEILANRSECSKLKVGCIMTDVTMRHIIGNGYNGGPKGSDYICTPAFCNCLHAEDNANVNRVGTFDEKILFVTTFPCYRCAIRLVNSNVKTIYYRNEYKEGSSHYQNLQTIKDNLSQLNIQIIKI